MWFFLGLTEIFGGAVYLRSFSLNEIYGTPLDESIIHLHEPGLRVFLGFYVRHKSYVYCMLQNVYDSAKKVFLWLKEFAFSN